MFATSIRSRGYGAGSVGRSNSPYKPRRRPEGTTLQTSELIQLVIVLVSIPLAVVLFVIAQGRRLLTVEAFDGAPRRNGELAWYDLIGGVVIWLFGQVFATSLAAGLYGITLSPSRTAEENLILMCGAMLGAIPALVFMAVRVNTSMPGGLGEWGIAPRHLLSGPTRGLVALAFVLPFMFTISAITTVLMTVVGVEPPDVAHAALEIILRERGVVQIGFIAIAVIAAPIVEEIVFRGWIQTTVRTSGMVRTRWAAIFATTVPFVLIHINVDHPASLAALPALYLLSLGLGWLYERTGNLWACIFMHMFFNASQVVLALTLYTDSPAGRLQ